MEHTNPCRLIRANPFLRRSPQLLSSPTFGNQPHQLPSHPPTHHHQLSHPHPRQTDHYPPPHRSQYKDQLALPQRSDHKHNVITANTSMVSPRKSANKVEQGEVSKNMKFLRRCLDMAATQNEALIHHVSTLKIQKGLSTISNMDSLISIQRKKEGGENMGKIREIQRGDDVTSMEMYKGDLERIIALAEQEVSGVDANPKHTYLKYTMEQKMEQRIQQKRIQQKMVQQKRMQQQMQQNMEARQLQKRVRRSELVKLRQQLESVDIKKILRQLQQS